MRHAASEHTPGPSGYDAELRRHNEVLRRAVGVQLHDHVLDIGCGTGQTTRQAARTAQAGSALGVDVSAPAIKRARELARAEGLRNVTFEHADAQVHRFPQERFDLAISRFGTMFFDDPVAAFANIGRALRPAGRLVMMVWQAHERNEWDVAIRQSLGAAEGPVAVASEGPDPFSLADPPTVTGDPAGCRVRRRHLHRRPRARLLRSGRGRRPRLGPRLHLHQRSPRTGWIPPPRRARSSVCARRSPRT